MYTPSIKAGLITIFVLLLPGLVPAAAGDGGTGTITGVVTSAADGAPCAYANVILDGTRLGAMCMGDGRYTIRGVPPGTYTVRVLMMGFSTVEKADVAVVAEKEIRVDFVLERNIAVTVPVIQVIGERDEVDVTTSHVVYGVTREDIETMPIDTPIEAAVLVPGFITTGGEIHSRGGRTNEVKIQIDGVPVSDPLQGSTVEVGMMTSAGTEVIAGGMDAEYGDAQSAVINIATREGGRRFSGGFRYFTDDFGRQDKTYTNFDRLSLGFGGPTWWKSLRYYVSGEATFSDSENNSIEPRAEHKITDWLKFRDRQQEAYNFQSKLTWNHRRMKVTGEVIYNRARRDQFLNNWNVQGYVGKIHYFQRLRALGESAPGEMQEMVFAGIARVDHGAWARITDPVKRARVLNIRPVVVLQEVRDPETGLTQWIEHTNFRAADIGATTVVWDEAVTDPEGTPLYYRPWVLFSGFQYPYSGFQPYLNDAAGADSAFVPFNSATRTPETVNRHLQLKLGFNHNVTSKLLYTMRFSRLELNTQNTVFDQNGNPKQPHQFDTAGLPTELPNGTYLQGGVTNATWYTDDVHPYLVTAYDFPMYGDQQTVQYLMRADVTSTQFKGHRIKSGIQLIYNDLSDDERVFPAQRRFNSETGQYQQGLNVNIYRNFNTEGAVYLQDKWEYEGMAVNGGLRFEFFSTGNNDEIEIHSSEIDPVVDQWKYNVSPRLGFAFPITDRDKFFFHYGRFTQWPSRVHLFRTQDMVSALGTLGNPNLEPMLTVSYQTGISHQFTSDIAGNFIVFNKDIYGLISSAQVTDDSTGLQNLRYTNRTYASSRGLEVSLEKRLTRRIGFEVYYTYSFADGVASDADFGRSAQGLTHLPTEEMPLDWDQRHTFNVTLRLQDRNKWGATAIYQYGSGLPWTPVDRFARLADPTWENSRRLEPSHRLRVQGRKQFDIYDRQLTLFFEGRNLLNDDILRPGGTAPVAMPAMNGVQMDGGAYLTETGRYGGAYLQDTNDDGRDEFNPVYDPTIWETHRVWRIGFGFEF
jgi:outer membrane receptor protein involved in Fe transport